jgi:hypothetical protein
MHCYYEVFAAGGTLNNGKAKATERRGEESETER